MGFISKGEINIFSLYNGRVQFKKC